MIHYTKSKHVVRLEKLAYVVTAVVLITVFSMRYVRVDLGVDFRFLPPFYSALNAIAGGILIMAYYFIRRGNIAIHRRLMTIALLISALFLAAYVLYHITTPETRFCRYGVIRILYFIILISHVVLAAVGFPLILFTYIRGLSGDYLRHRKLARVVFPLWLYVCLSGPVCYLLLYPCYPK